jgi:hypothetical protein
VIISFLTELKLATALFRLDHGSIDSFGMSIWRTLGRFAEAPNSVDAGLAMKTQKIAEVLGGIIGSMVLVVAFAQEFKHAPADSPKQAVKIDAPKASAVKGPVVRDITP